MIFHHKILLMKIQIYPWYKITILPLKNRQIPIFHIPQKLGMLQSTPLIKISSSKFNYPLYWKDGGIELTHLLHFPTCLPHKIDPFIELSLIEKSSFLTLDPFCLNSQSTILQKSNSLNKHRQILQNMSEINDLLPSHRTMKFESTLLVRPIYIQMGCYQLQVKIHTCISYT